jgi:NADH-quinone oxidoreductase subunit G/NADP-reducing hydrogenase subunit HndD
MIKVTIDGRVVEVEPGSTVLDAARQSGIEIPTLCFLKSINEIGACRVCVVEVEGARSLQASCVLPVREGMVVRTNTSTVREARRTNVELLLSNHPASCLTCSRNTSCELQRISRDLGVDNVSFPGEKGEWDIDFSNPALVRDPNKCILCRKCVAVCQSIQGANVLSAAQRGFNSVISPDGHRALGDSGCTFCGQCVTVCPTGALTESDDIDKVFTALDGGYHTVVQIAPAVRVAIGEEFGLPAGSISTGQLVTGLRMLGFDGVFDTDFTADLTILEEAHELLERVKKGGPLPLITSCSPGWIKYVEHNHPQFIPNLSSCKSPQQMMGALFKTYYATHVVREAPENIFSVSVMPCTAKKYEASRPEMTRDGRRDVDAVITTRELARMLKQAGIDLARLPASDFDAPLGISTGAAVIFGASGGVMEAALRTAFEWIAGVTLEKLDFTVVRGLEGVKEAEVEVPNLGAVKVAVASGLANARKLLEKIESGDASYHFVEIMACPGGCLGGGGQPRVSFDRAQEVKGARLSSIYKIDAGETLRKSHENPAVKKLYEEYLGAVGGKLSHELLHTKYTDRGRFPWRKG